jgi:hypothetical protein
MVISMVCCKNSVGKLVRFLNSTVKALTDGFSAQAKLERRIRSIRSDVFIMNR